MKINQFSNAAYESSNIAVEQTMNWILWNVKFLQEKKEKKSWPAQTVILLGLQCTVWFVVRCWYHHIHPWHVFVPSQTSTSALLPFLYAPSVNETMLAWSIMRFIFSWFLCSALPEVWLHATVCQNKESPFFFFFFQMPLLNTNDSLL